MLKFQLRHIGVVCALSYHAITLALVKLTSSCKVQYQIEDLMSVKYGLTKRNQFARTRKHT